MTNMKKLYLALISICLATNVWAIDSISLEKQYVEASKQPSLATRGENSLLVNMVKSGVAPLVMVCPLQKMVNMPQLIRLFHH